VTRAVGLVVATTNRNKVREIGALLAGVPVELITLDRWPDVVPPEETGKTFEENARLKALYYAAATGELVVAEDSGLEIDALGGVPGVESARYGGGDATYPEKFEKLYKALDGHNRPWTARFICALTLAKPDAPLFETRGTIEGEIASEPHGTGGFGYDPIFFYPPYARTLAEVTMEEKTRVSHRGKAFQRLNGFLRTFDPGLSTQDFD